MKIPYIALSLSLSLLPAIATAEIQYKEQGSTIPCISIQGEDRIYEGVLFSPKNCHGYKVTGLRLTGECAGIAPSLEIYPDSNKLVFNRVNVLGTVYKSVNVGTRESSVIDFSKLEILK